MDVSKARNTEQAMSTLSERLEALKGLSNFAPRVVAIEEKLVKLDHQQVLMEQIVELLGAVPAESPNVKVTREQSDSLSRARSSLRRSTKDLIVAIDVSGAEQASEATADAPAEATAGASPSVAVSDEADDRMSASGEAKPAAPGASLRV